ncbi:MAG TPA: NUDIX hydrolase [Patescibacteria group bacterium]|nr:NUDIX hydrolase [Patescibacteria group bacterium]
MPELNIQLLTMVFLFNSRGEVLLLQRSSDVIKRPQEWDLPGGKVDFNEDPNLAVLRELKEETGLAAMDCQLFFVGSDLKPTYRVTLFYKANTLSEKIKLSHEHSIYKWVRIDEIANFKMPSNFIKASKEVS